MEQKQIEYILSDYICANGLRFDKAKEQLASIINSPQVLEIIVKKTDNYGFRKIVKDFSLSPEICKMREDLERNIINNYNEYSLESVQQALCDLIFKNNIQNTKLTIETIRERAQYVKELKSVYDNYAELYERVLQFLEMKKESCDKKVLISILNDISALNKQIKATGETVDNITNLLFTYSEKCFERDLSNSLQQNGRTMFLGIEPEIITTENGDQVKFFKMQNQTENQSEFCLMARTMYAADFLMQENAMQKYQAEMGKMDYLSYSIIGQSKTGGFGRRNRVMFGFFGIGQGEMLACNTHDGQTNQYTLEKGKYVYRQEFLPIETFLKNTASYNEVVFTNPETILPSVIISPTETPDIQTIKIANALNIPILFIDESCYTQYPIVDKNYSADEYSYKAFLKEPLCEPQRPETIKA